MNTDLFVDRLYSDDSLVTGLQGGQAEQLLSWAEGQARECESEAAFARLCERVRLLNRYVAQGGRFDHLFMMVRTESDRNSSSGGTGDGWVGPYPTSLLF